jgi:NAD(P)H-hydrate epimerase
MAEAVLRLTAAQCREVDRVAIEEFGVPSIVLMENASRGLAAVAHRMMGLVGAGAAIHVLVGPGNNGGDGLAAARHLSNMGHTVVLHLLAEDAKFSADAAVNHRICRAMGLEVRPLAGLEAKTLKGTLVVDCLFGTGLTREVDGEARRVIDALNALPLPDRPAVLAADVPSGLGADSGEPLGAALVANHTVTFGAEKVGFGRAGSRRYTGIITVVDIGCPAEVFRRVV